MAPSVRAAHRPAPLMHIFLHASVQSGAPSSLLVFCSLLHSLHALVTGCKSWCKSWVVPSFHAGMVVRHCTPDVPSPYASHPVVSWRAQSDHTFESEVIPVVLGVVDDAELCSAEIVRIGLPIAAAEAMTVHKSVGLSIPAV